MATMPLTHDLKTTIQDRAQSDPDFRQALLREAVECILNGETGTGNAVLREYFRSGDKPPAARTPTRRVKRPPGRPASPAPRA